MPLSFGIVLIGMLAAIFSFGLIVFVHEMGHFLTARWAGIYCPQFAIGFGPKLIAFRWRGTEFSIRLFPLGGYVLMNGEDPGLEDQEESWHKNFERAVGAPSFPTTPAQVLNNLQEPHAEVEEFLRSLPPHRVYETMGDLEGNFNAKTTLQKSVVILGGVTMNYLCALLLLIGTGFYRGLPALDNPATARIAEVLKDAPGEKAGLRAGETILALNGNPVVNGEDFIDQVRGQAGKPIRLSLLKGQERRVVTLTPELSLAEKYYVRQNGPHLELSRLASDEPVPERMKLPWLIERVNGQPVTSLQQLQTLALDSSKLQLSGPQGDWVLPAPSNGFQARGVVGLAMDKIETIGFESRATSRVLKVVPGSLADRSGVKAGDTLAYLHNAFVATGQTRLDEVLSKLSKRALPAGQSYTLDVAREQARPPIQTLKIRETPPADALAFGVELEPITPKVVVRESFYWVGRIMRIPYDLLNIVSSDNTGKAARQVASDTTGPIGIIKKIYDVVSVDGPAALLVFVALLNAFIATFNLLPIPALDGARCFFIWYGAVRGRALNPEREARIHFVGIVLLLSLVLVISIKDVYRIWTGP